MDTMVLRTWTEFFVQAGILPSDHPPFAKRSILLQLIKKHLNYTVNENKLEDALSLFGIRVLDRGESNRKRTKFSGANFNTLNNRESLPSTCLYKYNGDASSPAFLQSAEWKRVRYAALVFHKGVCMCCGKSRKDGAILNVDHILPRKTHPQLALSLENLQILCAECNQGKGNKDTTDWRNKD